MENAVRGVFKEARTFPLLSAVLCFLIFNFNFLLPYEYIFFSPLVRSSSPDIQVHSCLVAFKRNKTYQLSNKL